MNSLKKPFLSMDSTYKLNLQKYPLVVIGNTDINHKFHFIAVAISKYETEQSFLFILESIQSKINFYFNLQWRVPYAVCDDSFSIQNSIIKVFGNEVVLSTCYVHLLRRIKTVYAKYLKNKG